MNIIVAEHIGFCYGVDRALAIAAEQAAAGNTVYTLGKLIHNKEVTSSLEGQGIRPVEDISGLAPGDSLVIRAHGAPPQAYEQARELGLCLHDATCPNVSRIHRLVEAACEQGKDVIVAGKPDHPEVEGIVGWSGGHAAVVERPEDADALGYGLNALVVAQTTCREEDFRQIVERIRPHCAKIAVENTICRATADRQREAEALARQCDVMLVVGDAGSANTRKLADTCRKYCKTTISVESAGQLSLEKFQSNDIIGIVAGASTPERMIREVITRMSELEKTLAEGPEVESPEIEKEATAAVEQPAPDASVAPEPEVQEPEQEAPAATEAEAQEEQAVPEAPAQDALAQQEQAAEAVPAAAEPEEANAEAPAKAEDEAGESSFAEAFEKTMVRIKNGQVITGTVVQIADGEVCVNIGYKSDGFVPKNEFSSNPDVNPADVLSVGDEIEVEVIKVNDGEGNVLLSHKSVEGKKFWDEFLVQAEQPDMVFEGIGKEVVKGGLIASINGIRAFVPASHISLRYVENISEYVGKTLKLKVIEADKSRKRIVASQKLVQQAEAERAKKEKWAQLEVGSKIPGIVRRLTDFGAFVDIGGVDGLVHVTDIAWGRVKHPGDVLKVDQEIQVLILNVDVEKERVSLGYKQLQPKPWTMATEKYPIGSVVEGKVVRIVPFGAFVALEPTIDGLIHISQVSVRRIAKVEDELNVGDMVRCKVLDVNPEAKRISLSRKQVLLDESPELAEELAQERAAEREKANAERAAQRQPSPAAQQRQAPPRAERPERAERFERSERSERNDKRPRGEDGSYELPPVQQATTSLADLFSNFTPETEEAKGTKKAKKAEEVKEAPAPEAEEVKEAVEVEETPEVEGTETTEE